MDPPPVQYVTTSDGYDIAYCSAGQGEPLVYLPVSHTHLQLAWERPNSWLRTMATRFRVVTYEGRGQGMSTRGLPASVTPTDFRRDLEAVIERQRLDRFLLMGYGEFAHVAVAYAVANPAKVRALILQSCTAVNAAYPYSALIDLAEENWELFLRTYFVPGQATPEEAERSLDYLSKTITQGDHVATRRAFAPSDISELLPRLRVPTLVLFPSSHSWLSPEHAARLAALVPDARLVLIGGSSSNLGDPVQGLAAIESFLEELPPEEREGSVSSAAASPGLSPREREVLRLIATGRSNQQIADDLVISVRTVERHVTNLYAKIGAHGKAEATAYAVRAGLA